MISPVLTLSPGAVEEDGVFRHPDLVPRDVGRVGDQDWLPRQSLPDATRPFPRISAPVAAMCCLPVTRKARRSGPESGTCHATAPRGRTLFALRSARRAGRGSPYPVCSQVTAHPNRTGFLHTFGQ